MIESRQGSAHVTRRGIGRFGGRRSHTGFRGRRLAIATLALLTLGTVAACVPPPATGGGHRRPASRSRPRRRRSSTATRCRPSRRRTPGSPPARPRPTTPADLHDHGDVHQPGRHLPDARAPVPPRHDDDHLRQRVGHHHPGAAHRDGIVGVDGLGGSVPTITASYSGLEERRHRAGGAPDVLHDRDVVELGRHLPDRPARVPPTRTTRSPTSTASVTVGTGRRDRHGLVGIVDLRRPLPDDHASYSGLVNGDTAPATPPTCSTTATSSSPVGTYPTSCSGAADPNYTFSYVDGTVTVTPAAASVTASSADRRLRRSVPAITPSYSGLVNGDTAPATAPTCSTTATSASPVGTYPTTCSGAADPNYTFTYVGGTVTITPAPRR